MHISISYDISFGETGGAGGFSSLEAAKKFLGGGDGEIYESRFLMADDEDKNIKLRNIKTGNTQSLYDWIMDGEMDYFICDMNKDRPTDGLTIEHVQSVIAEQFEVVQ